MIELHSRQDMGFHTQSFADVRATLRKELEAQR